MALPPDEDATTVPDLVGHLVALGARVHTVEPARIGLIAALGTVFLAGPTLSGETESGITLASLARPIRSSAVLLGKWLGLVAFGSGFVVLAGLAQCLAGFPFLSEAPLTATYLAWAAVWVAMVWGLAAASFVRKDL